MTALRHRMTQDLQLRGYADRTVEAYVRAVTALAQFYDTSPDQLSEEQVRGLLRPTARVDLERARHLLELHAAIAAAPVALPAVRCCPVCRRVALRLVARMRRSRAPPT